MKIVKTLPLTERWVILVVSTIDDVIKEVDRLSNGTYLQCVSAWESSKDSAHPDWTAQRKMQAIQNSYMEDARAIVESGLKTKTYYAPIPLNLGWQVVGLERQQTPGGTDPEYVYYCYLEYEEMPTEVRVWDSEAVELPVGEPSRAIKVNQVGYLPDMTNKYAYVGCWIPAYGPLEIDSELFRIVDSDGVVAYSGRIRRRNVLETGKSGRPLTGEVVYECDFSGFHETGDFHIEILGVGVSWPFRIAADVYGEAMYTAMRGIFHQRCGCPLSSKFTAWTREKCHTAPVYESGGLCFPASFTDRPRNYERFDVIAATTSAAPSKPTTSGGWHDAADWDRNNGHYAVLFDLLYAYEMYPDKFIDCQFHIPESGNGIPDILDEVAWGLTVWRQSMDSRGGISGWVECATHPRLNDDVKYTYTFRTRWDSLLFVAAAAMLAQHLKPFNQEQAGRWAYYAKHAYDFGANPKNSLDTVSMPAISNRGAGTPYSYIWTETDKHVAPFLAHAKMRMAKLTNDYKYAEGVGQLALLKPCSYPWGYRDYSPWFLFGLAGSPYKLDIQATFVKLADSLLAQLDNPAYRCTWDPKQDYWLEWGESSMHNRSRILLIAYYITGDPKYRYAAILNCDFMFGCNPMGMSWTTGLGQCYPAILQHEISDTDGIDDPVPGITLYGITGGVYKELKLLGTVDTPVWRCWSAHQTKSTKQCEFTIAETMSAAAFVTALLAPDKWRPSAELVNRKPKTRDELNGYYYLP